MRITVLPKKVNTPERILFIETSVFGLSRTEIRKMYFVASQPGSVIPKVSTEAFF
jgi:hypothetical protein